MVVRSKPGRLSNTQGTVAVHHSGEPLVPMIMTAIAVTVRQKLRFKRKWEIGGMQGMSPPSTPVYSFQSGEVEEEGVFKGGITVAIEATGGSPVPGGHIRLEEDWIAAG